MTAAEDRGDEVPDLMQALKDSVERAREQRRAREDRGVQVEARWPGECGECTDPADFDWSSINLPHIEGGVMICHEHGTPAPGWAYTDLVTLTDGGAES